MRMLLISLPERPQKNLQKITLWYKQISLMRPRTLLMILTWIPLMFNSDSTPITERWFKLLQKLDGKMILFLSLEMKWTWTTKRRTSRPMTNSISTTPEVRICDEEYIICHSESLNLFKKV